MSRIPGNVVTPFFIPYLPLMIPALVGAQTGEDQTFVKVNPLFRILSICGVVGLILPIIFVNFDIASILSLDDYEGLRRFID